MKFEVHPNAIIDTLREHPMTSRHVEAVLQGKLRDQELVDVLLWHTPQAREQSPRDAVLKACYATLEHLYDCLFPQHARAAGYRLSPCSSIRGGN